jgi:hypothetical protein
VITILGVLQNQWFNDPEKVRRIMKRNPSARRRMIHYALFAGCRTGIVLRDVFGEDMCKRIVWEEASSEIGDRASSYFRADPAHLRAVLEEVKPDVVLAFGKVAADALKLLVPAPKLITGPHPTARQENVLQALAAMRISLHKLIREGVPA